MDLKRHARRSYGFKGNQEDFNEIYQHDLQMYDKPPRSHVLLHEFEEMALERLKALKTLEIVNLRGFTKMSDEWKTNFIGELNKQGLKDLGKLYSSPGSTGLKNVELRRRDHISHFILCLAFCRTDELRNWFLNKEIELFQARFDYLSPVGKQTFLQSNNLDFNPIPKEEREARKERLQNTFQFLNKTGQLEKTDFYKVHFRKVVELVRSRRVLMERGQCYVSASDLGSVLAAKLRQDISHSLAVLRQCLPETSDDKRLDAVLKCLLEHYEAGSYRPSTNPSDNLRVEDLNELSKKSFPPCMRRLHEALTTKHHLRHGGRQQYQLFLKGAGLPMEETLRFWRAEFLKIMAPEKFEREHAYNIRHNYGKEGNRCNYSPYGCNKIIQSQPGPEDFHGCPFRHCKPQDLRRLLLSYGINNKGLAEVMEHQENQVYTLACQKLFVITHEKEKAVEFGLSHPNQYYSESRALITGNRIEKPAGGTPSSALNSPAMTATPGSALATPGTPIPSTPLSSKTSSASVSSTPTSRRTLNKPAPSKPAAKKNDASMEVSDWLDEPDEEMLEQIIAMETQ